LGFSGVARGAATIARLFFAIFIIIAIVLFIMVILGIGAITNATELISIFV
jgi:uncharacterized membrane protein YtjA (UPF0391 family)